MAGDLFAALRQQMLETIGAHAAHAGELLGASTISKRILDVMGAVPRHEFVPVELVAYAYSDQPLPIGFDKTISQPFIVALMTDLLDIRPGSRVLEVGTGLGYHAAVLAALGAHVYTVEIVEELATQADRRLKALGYDDVVMKVGNGERGWPEHAPFDRILVCAASDLVPPELLKQLASLGRMVVPTGMPDAQTLVLVEKNEAGRIAFREIMPVRFATLETAG